MRLDYAKGGLQFFFVTLASAERRAVFSRLVSESGRPELLDIGELARAALRAVHRVWPAVTVSDYVIMPDHLHFLLIVNYDYDKSIGPLFIAHRVADAVEMAVARSLERTGGSRPRTPSDAPNIDDSAIERRDSRPRAAGDTTIGDSRPRKVGRATRRRDGGAFKGQC